MQVQPIVTSAVPIRPLFLTGTITRIGLLTILFLSSDLVSRSIHPVHRHLESRRFTGILNIVSELKAVSHVLTGFKDRRQQFEWLNSLTISPLVAKVNWMFRAVAV